MVIQFTSYNAFENIAVHGNLLFEFGLGGVVLPSAFFQSYTVPLHRVDWPEILFLVLLIAPLTFDWIAEIFTKGFRFSGLNPQRYMLIAAIFAFCAHFDILDGVEEISWGNSEIYASKSSECALKGVLSRSFLALLVCSLSPCISHTHTHTHTHTSPTQTTHTHTQQVLLGFVDFFSVLTYAELQSSHDSADRLAYDASSYRHRIRVSHGRDCVRICVLRHVFWSDGKFSNATESSVRCMVRCTLG